MKRNLLKVIGISFLIFVLLSWFIPVGTYSSGKLSTDGIDPVGLIDLFNAPIESFITFVLYGVVFATIGGLYGVMEKTGALEKVTDKMSGAFTGKEKGFVILTVILFTVLSSLTGLILPLFVLVPLFAAVLFKLGYDKVVALASTVGGLLVGSIASTYGFNITGYTKNILSLDMNNQIGAKIILLGLLMLALIFTILMSSKKKEAQEIAAIAEEFTEEIAETQEDEMAVEEIVEAQEAKVKENKKKIKGSKKATEKEDKKDSKKVVKKSSKTEAKKASTKKTASKKTSAKKTTPKKTTSKRKTTTKALAVTKSVKKVELKSRVSSLPMMIIFILMLIICLIGMYNWYYSFGIEVFNDMHDAIMGVEIKDFPIFEHLLSGISQLGYWSNVEFAGAMIITSGIIAWIYKLKFDDYVEAFIAGVKKYLPTAIYAALASVILSILYQATYNGTGTLVDTINAKIFGLTDDFNVITTGTASLLGSFFFNDLYYLLADMSSFVSSFSSSSLSVAGLLIQSVYGIGMMIFPTSVVLIAGLSLFDVSYKDWIKYIWKFVLIAFLLVLLTCGIITLL